MTPTVAVLDYGSGNVRSAVRALMRVGASVELTADPSAVAAADGLFVPGVGNFHACMAGLRAVDGPALIDRRLAGGRPVLGVCVGMQVLFEGSAEPYAGELEAGLGQWPGMVTRLSAPVVPHMGWSPVRVGFGSVLFAGVEEELFYFVHSYAATSLPLSVHEPFTPPVLSWATHGADFLAAVENGPLFATQFHPEKSGDAGAQLLENWVRSL